MPSKTTEQRRTNWKKHYQKYREKYLKREVEKKKVLRTFVIWLKEACPCRDCGHFFPYYVMQFDHRDPTHKLDVIENIIKRGGKQRFINELLKCDIVCANCHMIRTHHRV